MRLAYGTHHSLFQNQARADGDIIKNYDLLQNMLGYGSLGIGAATGSWEKHLKGVEATLKDQTRHPTQRHRPLGHRPAQRRLDQENAGDIDEELSAQSGNSRVYPAAGAYCQGFEVAQSGNADWDWVECVVLLSGDTGGLFDGAGGRVYAG